MRRRREREEEEYVPNENLRVDNKEGLGGRELEGGEGDKRREEEREDENEYVPNQNLRVDN